MNLNFVRQRKVKKNSCYIQGLLKCPKKRGSWETLSYFLPKTNSISDVQVSKFTGAAILLEDQ